MEQPNLPEPGKNKPRIGVLRQYPNVLLIVQGEKDGVVWFHALADAYPVSDFTEMQAHPAMILGTITSQEIADIFAEDEK